jgi:hypothetical protein
MIQVAAMQPADQARASRVTVCCALGFNVGCLILNLINSQPELAIVPAVLIVLLFFLLCFNNRLIAQRDRDSGVQSGLKLVMLRRIAGRRVHDHGRIAILEAENGFIPSTCITHFKTELERVNAQTMRTEKQAIKKSATWVTSFERDLALHSHCHMWLENPHGDKFCRCGQRKRGEP